MAEVSRLLGRGAYDFAHKICNRYVLESLNTQSRSAAQASSLSAGFMLGDIKNDNEFGAENGVTVGVSHDGYTKVTPLFGTFNPVGGHGNVADCYYYIGLKESSLSSKSQVKKIGTNLPQWRNNNNDKFKRTFCSLGSAALGQFVFIRANSGNGTRSEPLYKTKTGYYEILEVTPTATHAQIKTAYYKQSFIYHPDRNAGSEVATFRFSDISEAYSVLGNKALRKKYDRGLLSRSDLTAPTRPSAKDAAAGGSARQQPESRRPTMGLDGQENVSDFDTFIKKYYNEQLRREKEIKVRKEEMMRKQHQSVGDQELGSYMELGVVVMLVMAVALMISLKRGAGS